MISPSYMLGALLLLEDPSHSILETLLNTKKEEILLSVSKMLWLRSPKGR